jgi:LemA protein
MLGRAETVDAAWAQVESTMQRRADLVPRLVEVVKRAMSHESQVLNDVAQQRTNPMSEVAHALEQLTRAKTESQAKLDALGGDAPVDADGLARVLRRSNEIARGVQVVLAVAEDYPTLRSSDQLLELQAQLEGSENRINVARMVFNDAVQSYNAALVQLPTNLFAGGMEKRAYFKASEEAHVAKALGL